MLRKTSTRKTQKNRHVLHWRNSLWKVYRILKEQGFDEVYHLKGGILKYLEEVPPKETLWEGECFVFDERVTVNLQLEKGNYDQCNAVVYLLLKPTRPVINTSKALVCPHCYDKVTDVQKIRFMEREKQWS